MKLPVNKSKLLLAPAYTFYLLFIALPLTVFFVPVFFGSKKFFEQAIMVLSDPAIISILRFTLVQALLSAFFSILIGLFGAWLFAKYDFPGKKFLNTLFMIPMIAPPVIVVTGIVLFFGNNGILNQFLKLVHPEAKTVQILYSFGSIIVAHTMYNFPIAIRIVGANWHNLSDSPVLAAKTLGANPVTIFARIIFPRLLPSLLSAFMLIFLYCFTSFVFVLILGGGINFTTLEVETFRLIRSSPQSAQAMIFALISLLTALVFLAILIFIQKKASFPELQEASPCKRLSAAGLLLKIISVLYLIFILVILLAPFVSLAVSSVTVIARNRAYSLSLASYAALIKPNTYQGPGFLTALFSSFSLGFAAASMTTITAVITAMALIRKNTVVKEILFQIPMAVSSLVFSYAYILISARTGISLFTGIFGIFLIHMGISLPFAIRSLLPAFSQITYSPYQSARVLGAKPVRAFFTGIWPQTSRAILSSFVFSAILSLGELTAVLLLGEGDIITMPLYIYRMLSAYHFSQAAAAGLVYLFICIGLFYLTEKIFKNPVAIYGTESGVNEHASN